MFFCTILNPFVLLLDYLTLIFFLLFSHFRLLLFHRINANTFLYSFNSHDCANILVLQISVSYMILFFFYSSRIEGVEIKLEISAHNLIFSICMCVWNGPFGSYICLILVHFYVADVLVSKWKCSQTHKMIICDMEFIYIFQWFLTHTQIHSFKYFNLNICITNCLSRSKCSENKNKIHTENLLSLLIAFGPKCDSVWFEYQFFFSISYLLPFDIRPDFINEMLTF